MSSGQAGQHNAKLASRLCRLILGRSAFLRVILDIILEELMRWFTTVMPIDMYMYVGCRAAL